MNHMMHNIAHFQTKTFMKRNKIIFLIYLTLSLGLQGASAESDWETCSRLQVTEGRKEEAVVEESQVASEKKTSNWCPQEFYKWVAKHC